MNPSPLVESNPNMMVRDVEIMYTVQCTLYSVYCIVYSAHHL